MFIAGHIVFGSISFVRLGISQLPNVDYPMVPANIRLEGAAPKILETLIIAIL
jgi:HAE1 family hydrophobic/amphiphilic exporter-1